MADLDDFFAKRDKKKPKGKKFETSDDVAKILETKAKERKKQETNKSMYTAPLTEDGLPAQPTNEYRAQGDEDDEWKEIIEEKPDLTGLKIGELVLNDDDSDVDANEQDGREGNEGVSNDGPWSKNKALRQKQKEEKEAQEKEKEKEQTESTETESADVQEKVAVEDAKPASEDGDEVSADAPKKYVLPSKRTGSGLETPSSAFVPKPLSESSAAKPAAAGGGGAYVPPSRRGVSGTTPSTKPKKTTAAPNIEDTNFFPSLGGS